MAGVVDEAVTGVRVVKGFGQEEPRARPPRPTSAARPVPAPGCATVRIQARFSPALQAIPALGQVAVLALGGWLAIEGNITLGTFLAFSDLPRAARGARSGCSPACSPSASRPGPAAERILDLLDANPPSSSAPDAVDARRPSRGEVALRGRHASATSRSEPVLDGFDLRVRARRDGGPRRRHRARASRPSPLLLPRFYDVAAGRGHASTAIDVRDVTLDVAAPPDRRGVRGELPVLRHRSAANIAYGRPDATDDEVEAAAAGGRGRTTSSPPCPTATTPSSASGASRCRAASASGSPWPGRCSPTPGCCCSTTPRRRSTPRTEEEIHATLRRLMRGPHDAARRPPPLDAAPRRPHRRGRRRPGGRQRHPRRAARPLPPVPPAARRARTTTLERPPVADETATAPSRGRRSTASALAARRSTATPIAAAARRRHLATARRRAWPAGGGGLAGPAAAGHGPPGWRSPPTPELLAQVAALPPADDDARRRRRASDGRGRPTRASRLRRFAPAVHAAAAGDRPRRSWSSTPCSTLAGPLLVRFGIDHGVQPATTRGAAGRPSACSSVVGAGRLAGDLGLQRRSPAAPPSALLLRPAHPDLRPPPAARRSTTTTAR